MALVSHILCLIGQDFQDKTSERDEIKLGNIMLKKSTTFLGLTSQSLLFVVILISLCFFAIPSPAHAGFGSFMDMIMGKKVSADTLLDNNSASVSNLASDYSGLLHSAVNYNPDPHKNETDMVVVSDSALLSESGPSGTIMDVELEPVFTQISTYTVHKGDTLEKIAEMYDVSVNTIVWANNISRKGALAEGTTLVILPISGVRHTVRSGDTLSSIAIKYKTDADDISRYNDLSANSKLSVGDTLIIPDAEPVVSASSIANISNGMTESYKGGSGPDYKGYYIRPITGGERTQGLHGYNGVDLADEYGTPIYASAAGTVIVSATGGYHGGYGNYVVIAHSNGTQTLYAHTSKNLVEVGDTVYQGQHIANVGSTGRSTGPHVHFEIRGAKNPF